MLVKADGISKLANELHLRKAASPMRATDDGIAMHRFFLYAGLLAIYI